MATNRRKDDEEKDAGMKICDQELAQTQARLSSAYRQAAEELTASFEEFMTRYEEELTEMQERLESGEITKDEYDRWVRNKILRSAQLQGQIDSMTQDLVNVDQIAMQMLNDDLVGAYVTGYNFSGFRGEMMAQAAGYEYASFSIYSRDALSVLMTEDPDLIPWTMPKVDIPKDMRWNRRHLQDAVTQGILQGDSIDKLSKRLLPVVNMDRNAAMRTARTSYTGVQNQGRREATARIIANGIPMEETWMSVLAGNTRDTHLLLHGTHPNKEGLFGEGILKNLLRFPADPLGDPDQIYNCQCRVSSFIQGIDHSNDDELYEQMMKEQYYEDWLEVKDYKATERANALERKRKLESGEITSKDVEKQKRLIRNSEENVDEFFQNPNDFAEGRGGITVSMEDRAKEIKNMSDEEIWKQFCPADSYVNTAQYKELSSQNYKYWSEDRQLTSDYMALKKDLQNEQIIKPRDQWDVKDEIDALIGKKPVTYTARGQEILSEMENIKERQKVISPLHQSTSEKLEAFGKKQSSIDIDAWRSESHPFVRADKNSQFFGFSTVMRSSYDEDLANGIGFIAEMSPAEYIQRCAYDIFGSTVETTTYGIEYDNIREYAQMMSDGVQFDMGYLDYGRSAQEGRHRAMAAYLLGIEKIPVYIRGA